MSENINDKPPVGSTDLLGAAMRLVGKLKMIHGLPEYQRVWERAFYKGPTYEDELEELESAITEEHRKLFPEEFPPNASCSAADEGGRSATAC